MSHLQLDREIERQIRWLLAAGKDVDPGHWQGVSTESKPDLITREILNVHLVARIPPTYHELQALVKPNLPWAETEFQERVGGQPHNPHHSLEQWPWWRGQEGATIFEGMFTHTYSERFWPRWVGEYGHEDQETPLSKLRYNRQNYGTRYRYGDLDDVLNLLARQPQTRQAYLPIFFPEDTGAVHGGRIPCTLGYHFMLRAGQLDCWYDIRSCDAVRHFRDDIYLACRLVQWVIAELVEIELRDTLPQVWVDVEPGTLYFNAHSLHVHAGDRHLL